MERTGGKKNVSNEAYDPLVHRFNALAGTRKYRGENFVFNLTVDLIISLSMSYQFKLAANCFVK